MDVNGVGAGPQAADFSGALRAVAHNTTPGGASQPAGDRFVSVLQELSATEMTALLNMIERPESPQETARLDDLLRSAVAAIDEGDGNRAMSHLAELAALSPRRAEALGSLPSLSSIRGPVESLVGRLRATAKREAEAQLAHAEKLMESAGVKEQVVQEIRADHLILIAGRLLDAGGYANCVWSAELSRLVIDPRLWTPNAAPLPKVKDAAIRLVRGGLQLRSRIRRMWYRAPLLILFLACFIIGLAGGAFSALVRNYWPDVLPAALVEGGFELWALGFLVLVAVGLYASIRNVRF